VGDPVLQSLRRTGIPGGLWQVVITNGLTTVTDSKNRHVTKVDLVGTLQDQRLKVAAQAGCADVGG
jgi:hypothetical protein